MPSMVLLDHSGVAGKSVDRAGTENDVQATVCIPGALPHPSQNHYTHEMFHKIRNHEVAPRASSR